MWRSRTPGLTVERLCDEVLRVADLTLASCPRANLLEAPRPDPFRAVLPRPRSEVQAPLPDPFRARLPRPREER